MLQLKRIDEFYTVYSDGRVFSHVSNKFLTPDTSNRFGYLRVTLWKPSKQRWLLHRLVAECFLEKVEGKTFVNHIDGDKTNNEVSNLEWVTQSENEKHAFSTGLKPTVGCTVDGVYYPSVRVAALTLGLSYSGLHWRLNSRYFPNYIKNA